MDFDINKYAHCFATKPNEAFFWHGRTTDENGIAHGGPDNAASIASANNGKTLEMCMLANRKELEGAGVAFNDYYDEDGFLIGTDISVPGSTQSQQSFWDACSKSFAEQASGDVHVIEGTDNRPDGTPEAKFPHTYNRIERPVLEESLDSEKVIGIIPINANGGKPFAYEEKASKIEDKPDEPEEQAAKEPVVIDIAQGGGGSIMKLIDVGKLKVSPFEFESILEMKIEKRLNEHDTLYICGIVKDDKQITPVTSMSEGSAITCENDGQIYFKGLLQSVKITCLEEVYRLEVFAISNTILLDTVKYKRSFQDNGQTYQSIVETIIKENSGTVTYNADSMTVENIILQYNETDWELAKRLASHTNDVLIPITGDTPSFHFGATDKGGASLTTNNYAISKEFQRASRSDASPKVVESTIYSVETDEFICELGEKFILNGADLYARAISFSYVNSALTIAYTLSPKNAISALKFYNPAITGLVLDGTVLKVENDNVKLHLHIDEEQDEGKAHLFVYATGYSMENHTGWYVMPEEGDTVQLLFPNEDEKYAYAASSVRQDDTERTGDHLVKYWRTSFGKEIKMDKNEILITALDETTFIRINEDESKGIEIITPHPILVQSGSTLNIESEDDMTITTNKNLYIQAKDSIEMVNAGNIMKFVPADGIAVSTDKKLEVLSEDNTTIDSKKEIGVKSGKDMTLDSGAKLVGAAQSKTEISCSGSSIMMASGGVDIKGPKIRQN